MSLRYSSTEEKLLTGSFKVETQKQDEGERETSTKSQGGILASIFPSGYRKEFKGTMSIAWALMLTQMAQIYFQPVATMFGGHLGKIQLDAVALSNTLLNVLGNSIVIGMSTCCDTVFSQAHGIGNEKLIGVLLQRCLIIHMLALLPCYALHLNITPILLALGQDEEVARLVGRYLLIFMPGMFFMFLWVVIRKYTQCQNIVVPHLVITFIVHGIHAILQYVFLYQFNLGIDGSAMAQATAFFLLALFTIIYTLATGIYKKTWSGWDRRCLFEWGPLAYLAFFGMLMMCLEWWCFEISTLLAGVLGTTELGAQSVAFNLDALSFGIPSGIALATSIRVGQYLGGDEPVHAKTAARVGMTITVANAVVWSVLYVVARYELPKLFTNDSDVISLVASILPFISFYVFCDAICTIGRGIFRGTGKQLWGTLLIFIAYYLIALPIAIPLMFLTSLGIMGMWIGFTIALAICSVSYFVIVTLKLNWQKLADEAVARSGGVVDNTRVVAVEGDTPHTEKTPLLRGRLLKTGQQARGLLEERPLQDYIITPSLILKRVLTVLTFLAVFLAGLVVRLNSGDVIASPEVGSFWNSTQDVHNVTTAAGLP